MATNLVATVAIEEGTMSKQYTIIVHTIAEDGLPPKDFEQAGLTGRVAFIFDGSIYRGWPINPDEDNPDKVVWEDSETAAKFTGVKKWIELPVAGWDL
jgi:hypothetical protein